MDIPDEVIDAAFRAAVDNIGTNRQHEKAFAQVVAEWARKQTLEPFRQLLDDLVDRDDCWFDHHGGCQAHGYLDLHPGQICPQQEAKDLIRALGTPEEES